MKFAISNFCRERYTKESPRSHFEGSEAELLSLVEQNFEKRLPGYREGVVRIPVPSFRFFSPIRLLKEGDRIEGQFLRRKEDEEPRLESYIRGEKSPAVRVEVILYRHDVLAENNEQSCDAEWEIIAVNASPFEEEEPIATGVLMANHFQISGGTATGMSDSEFVAALRKSFLYWRDKVSVKPVSSNEISALFAEITNTEARLEELWKATKGVDPNTGRMWLTPRMERDASKLQGIWDRDTRI